MINQHDNYRIQKVIDDVVAQLTKQEGKAPLPKTFEMETSTKLLLLDYVTEITCASVEESALLAAHRGGKEIDMADVNLVLGEF